MTPLAAKCLRKGDLIWWRKGDIQGVVKECTDLHVTIHWPEEKFDSNFYFALDKELFQHIEVDDSVKLPKIEE